MKLFNEGVLNHTLCNMITRLAKKIAPNDWDDLKQETMINLWIEDVELCQLEYKMRNWHRPTKRLKTKLQHEILVEPSALEEWYPENNLPIDRMIKLFDISVGNIKSFLDRRLNGDGLRKISDEMGIPARRIEELNQYIKEYYIYHSDLELQNIGGKNKKYIHRWNEGGYEGTKISGKNSTIRQYYIEEIIDFERFVRYANLPEDKVRLVLDFIREGMANDQIADFAHINIDKIGKIRKLSGEHPESIYISPLKNNKDSNNNVHLDPCSNTEFPKFCQNNKKSFWVAQYMSDVEHILNELGVPYKQSYHKSTAVETLIILDICNKCGNVDCIEVFFTNHKTSWVCHSCRTKAGGTTGDPIKMPDLYQTYPNNLKGLLKCLGAN